MPVAISLIVRIEQGAISMPSVWNEPDEIDAPMSPIGWNTSASSRMSLVLSSVS